LFFGLALGLQTCFAQISASASEGCAPLTEVLFLSNYSGATGINWNFGDGASSNLANPTHTFSNPGNYTVAFTALVNGGTVNDQLTISVYGLPEAQFAINGPDNGCTGLNVTFNDQSTGWNGAAIAQRNWSFGDGGVSSFGANPTYSYTLPGVFDVSLIVTDANGCVSSFDIPDAITISAPPTISITTNPTITQVCSAPFTVTFNGEATSNSPTSDNLTYAWNFGNGETSSVEDPPAVTFEDEGTYLATFTVTDDIGCTSSQIRSVNILNPFASFRAEGGENDTVCRMVEFVNESTDFSSYSYDYGDGQSGTSPNHQYSAPGIYNVTLEVTSGPCSDETTIQIVVQFPVVNIQLNPDTLCQLPGIFSVSAGANSQIDDYSWILPGEQTSALANPTVSIGYPTTEYSINEALDTLIELSIITNDGCVATDTDTLVLVRPNALFYPSEDEGCAPLTVSFTNYSSTEVSYFTQWQWHFGDGSPVVTTSNNNNVTHVYNQPGVYHPFLTAITAIGCRDTSWLQTIEVGSPPTPSFSIFPTQVCIGEEIQVTDTSSPSDSIDTWHYGGDEHMMYSCQTDQNPTVVFTSSTGTSEITMTAGYHGCYSTSTQTITVDGPLADLTHTCNCESPFTYPFTVETSDTDYWTWDFGDGTVIENSTDPTQTHVYAQTGDYTAVVTAYNATSGCEPYVDDVLIHVRNIQASFALADSACSGIPVYFDGLASTHVAAYEADCYNSFAWYFGDNTRPKVSNGTYQHAYNSAGQYTAELWVEDINGCVDSTSTTIYVSGIDVDLEYTVDGPCLPMGVSFQPNATSDMPLIAYAWSFGDSEMSSEETPSHTYLDEVLDAFGNVAPYEVTFQATNSLGCIEQDSVQIIPNVPNAEFSVLGADEFCLGGTAVLDPGITPLGNQFLWDFGDGTGSSNYSASHQYAAPGQYDVSLTVTNELGCSNTETYDNFIFVQDFPHAGFESSVEDGQPICYPVQITFTDTSVVNPFGERSWDLGNGDPAIGNQSVGTNYNAPGNYTIQLIVQSTAGCADTTSTTIEVVGPIGNFIMNPFSICRGDEINLQITDTTDVMTWQWDFGDGLVEQEGDLITHDYEFGFNPASGQTLVSLILWNEDSICSVVQSQMLDFVDAYADFARNTEAGVQDTAHCVGIADSFTNLSSAGLDAWFWDFGNGQTYSGVNPPSITYEPGTYDVMLAVLAQPEGCVDTITKVMLIHPLPQVEALGGAICLGDNFELNATGGVTYEWEPESLVNDNQLQNPIAFPDSTTEFMVVVTDTNGCVNNASTMVAVYEPLDEVDMQQTLIIGETYELDFPYGGGYTFDWTPDVWISCTDCANPIFQPLEDTVYYVTIEDTLGCYSIVSRYEFDVLLLSSLDVPDAFTPNGDSMNDIVYVEGWGIERVLEFKIFNRWGELVFETTNVNQGWDGTYKGRDQMADTYSYIVSVKPYIQNSPLTKQGFINLIR